MKNSNPIWRQIQDGGLDILNALLQYGYQLKWFVMNNSKKKVTLPDQWTRYIFNALLQHGYQIKGVVI
jgi:hypothetical protein